MICQHFLAPENGKKVVKVFWATLELIENGFVQIYHFFDLFRVKNKKVQLSAKTMFM